MKNKVWTGAGIAAIIIFCVGATTGSNDSDKEIVKALNIQNQQLDRIADALERISGQQPGWKLPK